MISLLKNSNKLNSKAIHRDSLRTSHQYKDLTEISFYSEGYTKEVNILKRLYRSSLVQINTNNKYVKSLK